MSSSPEVPLNADTVALMALADSWDRYADRMDQECKHKPCAHNFGYRQAATDLRQALASNDSLKAEK